MNLQVIQQSSLLPYGMLLQLITAESDHNTSATCVLECYIVELNNKCNLACLLYLWNIAKFTIDQSKHAVGTICTNQIWRSWNCSPRPLWHHHGVKR